MPRIVDRDRRRTEIAEAVWGLILRDGLQAASVRRVCDETGLSMGSLRHFFHTQDELLTHAMALVEERARSRTETLELSSHAPIATGEALLAEILPLDRERLAEAQVWTALSARSLVNAGLARVRDRLDAQIRDLCKRVVEDLNLTHEADLEMETERLYALVDGLAMHAVMRPEATSAQMIREIVRHHLMQLSERG